MCLTSSWSSMDVCSSLHFPVILLYSSLFFVPSLLLFISSFSTFLLTRISMQIKIHMPQDLVFLLFSPPIFFDILSPSIFNSLPAFLTAGKAPAAVTAAGAAATAPDSTSSFQPHPQYYQQQQQQQQIDVFLTVSSGSTAVAYKIS